ncbi:hypothetical protein BRADI_1g77720v3 [Brachypodium distachyon]|uniref:Gnk2-homologous domain-containing protein n=1 Tax=Brachypodium distachyon TaxID=15368 RepID=I1HAL5_BRADI|nr:hypothetical protein BRADI_1g77720v3 [Brachypodium distachyon]
MEIYVTYQLCTFQLLHKLISWSFQVHTILEACLDSTVRSKTFDSGTDALFSSVASIGANSSQKFATAAGDIYIEDGANYTAYGLAQCLVEMTPADCARCLENLRFLYSYRAALSGNNKKKMVILGVALGGAALAWVILRWKRQSSRQNQESSNCGSFFENLWFLYGDRAQSAGKFDSLGCTYEFHDPDSGCGHNGLCKTHVRTTGHVCQRIKESFMVPVAN